MKMTATSMGFYKGKRIRAGATFEFNENERVQVRDKATGKLCFDKGGEPVMVTVKLPKWAEPAGQAAAAKPARSDTKPADAAAAAKAKTTATPSGEGDTKPADAAAAAKAKTANQTPLA
jgi:hypothetical protein